MPMDRPASPAVDTIVPATATPLQGRKRPLRTYSRRSVQPRVIEQELSKRDGTSRATTPGPGRSVSPVRPELPSRQEPAEQTESADRPSRGSILAYFKPTTPTFEKASSDLASSDAAESPPTPPTTPQPPSRSRKRRRLTTRPQFSGVDQQSAVGAGDTGSAGGDPAEKHSIGQRDGHSEDENCIVVSTEAHDTMRQTLSEVSVNVLDRQDGLEDALTDGRVRPKKRPEKRPARDMTQTTLSLSVHKEPGFTICGVCDILYNPLNEKDRKEHSRRHAAYSRNKTKAA